jgi:2,3-bisphosphoglycerate-independent phosphoglycerate mutase
LKLLFIFLDVVGFGVDDPQNNPFARAEMPALLRLLDGHKLISANAPLETERAMLLSLDARLGVPGLPQSATGQAVLLTGVNVPAAIGRHYGPKPDKEVASFVQNGTIFSRLKKSGQRVAFLNAYPPSYFESIQSGRRLYAAIPLAAVYAGLHLNDIEDLRAGRAISADFTARGWCSHLNLPDIPILTPVQAGQRLAQLAQGNDFSLFEYWLSDYAGHHQDMQESLELLRTFDQVLDGLLQAWDDRSGLILVTSDHGNIEDISTRRHTLNPVPGLVVGAPDLRRAFASNLRDISDVSPSIQRFLIT